MRYQGKITEWNDERGFGFVTSLEGESRVFVHVNAFPPGSRRPRTGEYVNYTLGRDEFGRVRAEHATYVVSRTANRESRRGSTSGAATSGVICAGVLAGIGMAAWAGKLPLFAPVLYTVCSIGAYWHYQRDKAAARRKEWRAEEVSLLIWGVFGGWPGALFAQYRFRHKVRKTSFQVVFWITVMFNCAVLALVAW